MTEDEAIQAVKEYFSEEMLPSLDALSEELERELLVRNVFGNEDGGWEVELLFMEAFWFEVDDDRVECTAQSVSPSKLVPWSYPDDRFNGPDEQAYQPI